MPDPGIVLEVSPKFCFGFALMDAADAAQDDAASVSENGHV